MFAASVNLFQIDLKSSFFQSKEANTLYYGSSAKLTSYCYWIYSSLTSACSFLFIIICNNS